MNNTTVIDGFANFGYDSTVSPFLTVVLSLVLTLSYMFALHYLARKGSSALFYSLLFIPLFLPVFALLMASLIAGAGTIFLFGLSLVYVLYVLAWGVTLYEVASEGYTAWFILIFIMSPLWLVYRITR